jgi:tryptophan-rich sensory protein
MTHVTTTCTGAQKAGGIGNNIFTIKRTSTTGHFPFVPCDAERSVHGEKTQMNDWYESLQRPALTPPNWVFGPVWAVLYIMIAVSIFLFIKNHKTGAGFGIYVLIAFHLIANFSWTALFFRLQSPILALIDIFFLDISLVLIIYCFWKARRIASILLWPYLLWVLFATYLNFAFYVLNKT